MKVYLATDHAGFLLKEEVKKFLEEKGYQVEDCGAFELNNDDDYPDFISVAARKVSENNEKGIVFGKSGAGEAIVANKIKGIRGILGVNKENIELARQHNDANILSLGSDFVDYEKAKELTEVFLKTEFSNEQRHLRRIEKIREIEELNE